jgi:hypothetical protein
VKKLNHKTLAKRKRKIEKRLERKNWEDQERPMFKGINIRYEMDDRNKGIACGGIGVTHRMAKRLGLVKEIHKHRVFGNQRVWCYLKGATRQC